MSDVVEREVTLPNVPLVETDGEPLESSWHRAAINLLIEVLTWLLRDRSDYYVGGNLFIYFSEEQARTRKYRGTDFFYVEGVNRLPKRRYWAVWQEGGRYPDVIIELVSPTTAQEDRTTKKDLYERTFRTHEYYCYDPDAQTLEGWWQASAGATGHSSRMSGAGCGARGWRCGWVPGTGSTWGSKRPGSASMMRTAS
jgi:Uma2 family endonuclease